MSEFHFLRPAWFLALVPALLLVLLLWRRRGASGWQAVVSPRLLPHLLLASAHSASRLPLALLGLGWLLAVTALAGPAWERQPQPVYRAPVDRVLVLDMSPSMAAADLRPDRLTRARFAIQGLLAEAGEGRTALVVFGDEPHVVTPLTDDTATIEALLQALTTDLLPAPGDRGGPALRLAAELLQRVGSTRGEVLLLSDGVSDPADSLEAIHALAQRNVPVSVLGIGTPAGAPVPAGQGGFETAPDGGVRLARLDESGLAALARAGGGRYLRLGNGSVTTLLLQSAQRNPLQASQDRQGLERWVEQGPWLLLPLLLIAASGFRRGWLGVLVVLLIPPPPAQALGWQDLWSRPDQQAARLLEQGEAQAAAERFQDRDWQALAQYQAGDYAAAAAGFAGDDADSRYNRGNALARAGRLQEALDAYDQVLGQQPGHEDARFNRELVRQLLQSQQQPSGQGSGADQAQDDAGQAAGNEASDRAQEGAAQSAQDKAQAGGGQESSTADNGNQQQDESATGQSHSADAGDQAAQQAQPGDSTGADTRQSPDAGDLEQATAEPQAEHASGADAQQSPDARGMEQAAEAQADAQDRAGDAAPDQPDSAAQARADVAPSLAGEQQERADAQAQAAAAGAQQPDTNAHSATDRAPLSEQQLALEQWLRQVPDDPAGLLRRKFMIEHLMRQKRGESP